MTQNQSFQLRDTTVVFLSGCLQIKGKFSVLYSAIYKELIVLKASEYNLFDDMMGIVFAITTY